MGNDEDENKVVDFTIFHRRRLDRLERAVSGYTDEGGVFVPGLLQNTADGIAALRTIKRLVYVIVGVEVLRALGLASLAGEFLKAYVR